MATGIPSKNGNTSSSININIAFQLNYEGKIPAEHILKTQPAKLKHVVTVDKQPKNKLIYGENLRVLSFLLKDPTIVRKVGLIYIDPPYATGSSFESRQSDHAYHDCPPRP